MFDSESNDINRVRRERLSTRLYLLLLFIFICTITLYTIVLRETVNISIVNPSQSVYENLLMVYSKSLTCPCSKVSIEYKTILSLNTTFHQICSSDFVSEQWRDYLFLHKYWYDYVRADIRVRGAAYFSFLSTLCIISQTTVTNSIDQFLQDTFVSTQLISKPEFHLQIDNIIYQFQTVTSAKFSRSLKLIRDIINGNAFVSSYFLNWYWWRNINSTLITIPTRPVIMNDGCSCGTRSDCVESGGIYYDSTNREMFAIPGWNIGCSVVETLLRSTFDFLYNQTSINLLLYYATTVITRYPYRINISAINSTNESRFKKNTIIEDISNELFVEKWNIDISYSAFYNQCSPIYCSYEIEKENFIYIISKILGLYGGLTIALRFIVQVVTAIIFKIQDQCRRNTVIPQ